jgi:hypothetical protein
VYSSRIAILLLCCLFGLSPAFAAKILIHDGQRREVSDGSSFTSADGISLRRERKVAVGVSVAGPLAVLGGNLELNFDPQWGIMGGFGTGFSYQTWTFQVKRVLAGEYLLPYLAGGIARWYTTTPSNGRISDNVQPSYLQRFLSDSEKESGQFSKILLYPAFGLQYMQLSGDYAGLSVYAEVCLLLNVGDMESAPTGTLGMLYYF